MNSLEIDQEVIMREFADLLKEQKKLKVLDASDLDKRRINNLEFAFCVHVQDEDKKEYSLLINDRRNHKDVHRAKIKSKHLKSLNHPNLVKYFDDFTIGQFHAIQIERIHTSLSYWINETEGRNPLSELNYVEIAIQMLEATYYLNKNKHSLDIESTLSSFVIDDDLKIKLIHFVTPSSISVAKIKSSFSQCRENNELFYYRIDLLKMPIQCKVWQTFDVNFWAVGICLYRISGASVQHILNYLTNVEPYQYQEYLGFENNALLFSIICDSQKFQNFLSFTHLIYSFEKQKESAQQKERLFKLATEDYQNQQDQIKYDFDVFSKIHKQMYNNRINESQHEEIQKLIVKYPQFDQLYSMQTKYLMSTNRFEEGILICNKMIEMNPKSDVSYFNLGYIYDEQENLEDSLECFTKSILINPLQYSSYSNIGMVYEKMKSIDSIKYLKKSIDISCNHLNLYFNLGILFFNNCDHLNAVQCLKKQLKLKQNDSETFEVLVECYQKTFKFEKSMNYLKVLIQTNEELGNYDNYDAITLIQSHKKVI